MKRFFRPATASLLASAALTLTLAAPAAAETTLTVQSTGAAFLEIENTVLADGSTVQVYHSQVVWMNEGGDFAGQPQSVTCTGQGMVTAEGSYSGVGRCDTVDSAEDAYTTTYTDTAEGGDWVVTGGRGKYAGATGSGQITYIWGDAVFGQTITMISEGTITLP